MKAYKDVRGVIYDIQRYSVHDGPGIRTTIFLKGCPLRCLWCSNPESQSFEPEYMSNAGGRGVVLAGKEVSVSEVIETALRDKVFFEGSGGGITLSGGEVLAQPDFAAALISAAHEEGIHIAVETSGFSSFEIAWRVMEHVDLILYDIKGMNAARHISNTGVSNELIHSNLRKLLKNGKEVAVRIPMIPGHNDSVEEIQAIFDFASQSGVKTVEILPYHRLGESKYDRLSREYLLKGLKTHSDVYIRELLLQVSKPENIDVIVNGLTDKK